MIPGRFVSGMTTFSITIFMVTNFLLIRPAGADIPATWKREFPKADFSRILVPVEEILSGGPPRDGIPPIDQPRFRPAHSLESLSDNEPVIRVEFQGQIRGYPLSVLTWHEIVNDRFQDRAIAVTYCPLCNAAIAFEAPTINGEAMTFGTTGRLRHSDLLMYDRQTESWWQQFSGEAILGHLAGQQLTMIPVRVEDFGSFKANHPEAPVLVPNNPAFRDYGRNPYRYYDQADYPMLYRGDYDLDMPMMARLVVVDDKAWPLCVLRQKGEILQDDLRLSWRAGMASALDSGRIADGRDVGVVTVQKQFDAIWQDAVHDITFAFVFNAFKPKGRVMMTDVTCH